MFARRGIVPEACSSWFLPRLVGISRAAEWVYTGRVFGPDEALAGNLVSRVVAPEALLPTARALARDPDVLFLDEPTASLDPASTKAIEDVIRTVSQRGIKVLLSTHDLGEARRLGGEVVLLHRGRVVETAAAADFFESPLTDEARRFIAGELLV